MTNIIIILSIIFITLLLNGVIDYILFKVNKEEKSLLENIKNKKVVISYCSIVMIEIILWIIMGNGNRFYLYYAVILVLYKIAIIDYKTKYIDNTLLVLFILITIVSVALNNSSTVIGALITGVITFILLALFSKVTKGAFGMGDAYVISLLSIIFGYQGIMNIMIAASILIFFVSAFLLMKSRANKNKELPFTPYIFVSLILMLIINNI